MKIAIRSMYLLLFVGLIMAAQPASAAPDSGPTQTGQICMQKVFGTPVTNSNKLNCTANDIRLSRAISVSPDTCIAGSTINLTATFETIVTANSRYDAGFFFRIDGGSNARGDGTAAIGICSLSALSIPPAVPGLNLDGDTCGDLNAGTYTNVTFTIPGVKCEDSDGDGFLNLPNCTSWHSNQGTACNINAAFDFDPDTKSKCVCDDTFEVPVKVEEATLTVLKDVSPSSVPETGGTVTYTVQVTNDASFVSVTIDSIVDCIAFDAQGNCTQTVDLTTIPTCGANQPPPTCTAAGQTSCASLKGVVLAPGGSATCYFSAFVSGDFNETKTDKVEVCGIQVGNGAKVCDDDPADVTITDVPSTPGLQKTAQSAACTVDVTYQVVVSNNSEIDTLTVNSLCDDKFGDITGKGNSACGTGPFRTIVSTDCVTGGSIAPLGNYPCTFVGRIISPTCTINHVDTVIGNVTDDDKVTSTLSDTATVTVTNTLQ